MKNVKKNYNTYPILFALRKNNHEIVKFLINRVELAIDRIGYKGKDRVENLMDIYHPPLTGIEEFDMICYQYDLEELAQLDILKDEKSIKAIEKQLQEEEEGDIIYFNAEKLLELLKK